MVFYDVLRLRNKSIYDVFSSNGIFSFIAIYTLAKARSSTSYVFSLKKNFRLSSAGIEGLIILCYTS